MHRLKPEKKYNKTRPKYKRKNNRNSGYEDEEEYDDNYSDEDSDNNEEENEVESKSETEPNIQRRKTTRPIKSQGKSSKSNVWKYFDRFDGKTRCKKCKKEYKASTATTTLRRHLETHGISAPKRNQIAQESIDNRKKCVRSVTNWFLRNNISFNTVECEEWQKMITNFGLNYQSLDQRTLNEDLATLFEEKKKGIKLMVQNLKVAFTTFAWISDDTYQLYLSIHFVDNSWKLNSFLLNIIPIETCYDKDIMANKLMEVLNELDLAEKTLALTTNHTYIPTGKSKKLEEEFNKLRFAHYRCAAHVLNQAVIEGIDLIKASIDKVRLLMAYLQTNETYLEAACKVKDIEYLEPKSDNNTWISIYDMLKRWKILGPVLSDLINTDESIHNIYPNNDDCKKINDTMTILKLIESATHLLSKHSYPTRGDTCFVFICIQKYLSRLMNDDSFSQKTMAEIICQVLSGYWQDESIELSLISSLLDPRTKKSAFSSEEEQIKAKNLVMNLTEYVPTAPTQKIAIANDDAKEMRKSLRQLCWDDSSSTNTFNSQNSPNNTIKRELEKYLETSEDQGEDPLLWWQDQQKEFPILSQVARDYLCIQAMSVIPEKVFLSEFIKKPPIQADISYLTFLKS